MRGTQIASPLRRGWLRLLDGERPWGSLVVQPDRFGVTRYRLVVFPPGISEPERRWVRLARGWPMWGAGGSRHGALKTVAALVTIASCTVPVRTSRVPVAGS